MRDRRLYRIMSLGHPKHRLSVSIPVVLLLAMLILSTGCLGKPPRSGEPSVAAVQNSGRAAVAVQNSDPIVTIVPDSGRAAVEVQDRSPVVAVAPDSVNVGVVEIPDVSGFKQVVAVSDAHGMADNLLHLLSACKLTTPDGHWLADRTLLIVVGDSIDKGPQGLEIIDLWRTLSVEAPHSGSRVVVLLGNHEAEFLADPNNKKAAALREELQAKGSDVRALLDPARPRGRFLRSLPLAARVGKRWLFCHAGWPPRMPYADFVAKAQSVLRAGDYKNDLLLDPDSILEKRAGRDGGKWWDDPADVQDLKDRLNQDGLYGVVFGHQPEAFGLTGAVGAYDPHDARLIKIDSGMAPDAGAHFGHLLRFTAPDELTHDKRPTHIFSSGFDSDHPELRTEAL